MGSRHVHEISPIRIKPPCYCHLPSRPMYEYVCIFSVHIKSSLICCSQVSLPECKRAGHILAVYLVSLFPPLFRTSVTWIMMSYRLFDGYVKRNITCGCNIQLEGGGGWDSASELAISIKTQLWQPEILLGEKVLSSENPWTVSKSLTMED